MWANDGLTPDVLKGRIASRCGLIVRVAGALKHRPSFGGDPSGHCPCASRVTPASAMSTATHWGEWLDILLALLSKVCLARVPVDQVYDRRRQECGRLGRRTGGH